MKNNFSFKGSFQFFPIMAQSKGSSNFNRISKSLKLSIFRKSKRKDRKRKAVFLARQLVLPISFDTVGVLENLK